MKTKKWEKTELISLLEKLTIELGEIPRKKQWNEDARTPSDMPIRMIFGNWTNFIIDAGYKPRISKFTNEARQNSIKSRTGKKGGNNKGGRIVDKSGYVQIWMPNHPNAKIAGYIHEHRLVMSEKIGRPLESFENVHHKNGDRKDNRVENLELWDKTQPSGQRVSDKIDWAIEFLNRQGYSIKKL